MGIVDIRQIMSAVALLSNGAGDDGIVELKNEATIENAHCGIRTGLCEDTVTFATTGGIITATDTRFVNNRRAVEVNPYAFAFAHGGNVANYSASFENCSFSVDPGNLFAANSTAFAEHVRLWDVKGVAFKGCDFNNSIHNTFINGRGIYAEEAGLTLDVKCDGNFYGITLAAGSTVAPQQGSLDMGADNPSQTRIP